jgi:hypothetical protein
VAGEARDIVVEGCMFQHAMSKIRTNGEARGVLFRNNTFAAGSGYEGKGLGEAVVLPAPVGEKRP